MLGCTWWSAQEPWGALILLCIMTHCGFFHFGRDHTRPIASLEAAIAEQEVRGSLIVLPEAFNIAKPYHDYSGLGNFDQDVLDSLRRLAVAHDVTFVAGLTISQSGQPVPPYSSAYLINSTVTLLCHKASSDNTPNYTPCPRGWDTVSNFAIHGGVCVGALLCLDATGNCPDETLRQRQVQRHEDLKGRIHGHQGDYTVVCIPAHMASVFGAPGIARRWSNHYTVLANSDPCGCDSFISRDGQIIRTSTGEVNIIVTEALLPKDVITR
jgi:hypothetical protein